MNAALPLDDVLEEADRLLTAAAAAGVTLRLIGGVAVWFHTDHVHPVLARPYGDIDFATTKGGGRRVAELIAAQGYEPAKEFNALNGSRRLLFHDHAHDRKVDVFVATFEMCHTIPIADRLDLEERTIPLAELLLTKLQIVELTEKDVRDTLALLHEHDVADHDGDAINAAFVARLTANDWGLWRTVKLNVERLAPSVSTPPTRSSCSGGSSGCGRRSSARRSRVRGSSATASATASAGTSSPTRRDAHRLLLRRALPPARQRLVGARRARARVARRAAPRAA
jgi:hypothetical protein